MEMKGSSDVDSLQTQKTEESEDRIRNLLVGQHSDHKCFWLGGYEDLPILFTNQYLNTLQKTNEASPTTTFQIIYRRASCELHNVQRSILICLHFVFCIIVLVRSCDFCPCGSCLLKLVWALFLMNGEASKAGYHVPAITTPLNNCRTPIPTSHFRPAGSNDCPSEASQPSQPSRNLRAQKPLSPTTSKAKPHA